MRKKWEWDYSHSWEDYEEFAEDLGMGMGVVLQSFLGRL